jgi:hypothetical protein
MKYSILTSTKKKRLIKKLKSGTNTVWPTLPSRPMTATTDNIRASVSGEKFIRDFQYPQTIRNVMKDLEVSKLKRFVETLSGNPLDPRGAFGSITGDGFSRMGCLRWVYDNRFFNDGQDRYEAADDVSFDVRGNFCFRCETARRLVELRPIAFDAPSAPGLEEGSGAGDYYESVVDGFTGKDWTWLDEPAVEEATITRMGGGELETREGNFICEISKDLFKALLTMVQAAVGYSELRDVATSYRCGERRVYVAEAISNKPLSDLNGGGLDYQTDIVKSLRELATPVKINDNGADVSVIISEINPFMIDNTETTGYLNECFYNPRLVVNQWSRVIYSMAIRLNLGSGNPSFLFVCPEFPQGTVDYRIARELLTFPDNDFLYPAMFYGRGQLSEIILYSVMFLMERNPKGEFSKIVTENPEEFYKICRRGLTALEAEFYRRRLVMYKRDDKLKNYPSMIRAIRSCFSGLSVHKHY